MFLKNYRSLPKQITCNVPLMDRLSKKLTLPEFLAHSSDLEVRIFFFTNIGRDLELSVVDTKNITQN